MTGNFRLIMFDLRGKPLHSHDISFYAGGGLGFPLLANGGISIGPNGAIVVEIPVGPKLPNQLITLSSELLPARQIDNSAMPDHSAGSNFLEKYRHTALLPENYEATFAGNSMDNQKAAFVAIKVSALCDAFNLFCPSNAKVVVFLTKTKHPIFKMKLPLNAHAYLSPTGKKLAVFEHNRLEIWILP